MDYRNPQQMEYPSYNEGSRFINTLPGSQDSQQDKEEEQIP